MAMWTINAEYDAEAAVWFSVEGDVPGLLVDGANFEVLASKAAFMLPDLLEIHAEDIDPARAQGPHTIRIVAHHEREFSVAA